MAFSIQQAARDLAEIQDGIDWCRRTLRGGVMHSDEHLIKIHKHVPVDYRNLLHVLLDKKGSAERELAHWLAKDRETALKTEQGK